MAYSLDQIDWCDVPLVPPIADPVWEKESLKRMGFVSTMAKYLVPVRWLLQADELMRARVTPNIPVDLSAMISLVVAMDNSCRYCYGAFRSMLKIMGHSEVVMRKLEENLAVNQLTTKERVALEFARKVSRSSPRPSETDLQELIVAGWSPMEIAEIVYLVGNSAAGNRLATLLAIPPDPLEEIEANWFDKLKRPFSRQDFRASLTGVFDVPPPANYEGPGRQIVEALKGSPAGAAVATVQSSAWHSPITSRRTKAIVFVVVARGLGCEACETEAAQALRHDGWTDDEIKHLLTYLTSERLDAFELKVLRFARETLRYQTRRLQDLARNFATGLERDTLLEVIGLVAYANGLARMSILLQRR
jgi:alkylhydroperoxidase family enzyme